MTNDPRFHGGQEYAPQQMQAPAAEAYPPQPVMRQAPPAFQPQPAPHSYAAPPQVAAVQPVAPVQHYPAAPAPVAAPVAAPVPAGNEIILSKAYIAHDEEVDRITLRKPVTRDIKHLGNPLRVVTAPDGTIQDFEVRWDLVAKYITALASPPLPPSTVDQFEFFDLDACAAVIARFFVKLAP
jgi:hypothetical protein